MFSAMLSTGLHELGGEPGLSGCVAPGTCVAPNTKYSRVVPGPVPGLQWNINGGFCGAFSVQHAALSAGAWISQDLVRKANRNGPGPHHMHGDETLGYEVVPVNVAATAEGLKLRYSEWDYNQPAPQAAAYKRWLKAQLTAGHPVVWFPMCKGDGRFCPYWGACPNGGVISHVEPMWGIYSNHPLNDTNVFDDDWILHASDQDKLPYYRPLNSLDDSTRMDGNCKNAQPGFGRNEMYPCFDEHVTYGLAVKGLAVTGGLPVSLSTDGAVEEPNVRTGASPTLLHGTVTVSDVKPGGRYVLYRYNSTESLPSGPPFQSSSFASKKAFVATGSTWTYDDPMGFPSSGATYYVAAAADTVERAVV